MNSKDDRKEEGKRIGNDQTVFKLKEVKDLLIEKQLSERRLILKHYMVTDAFTHGSVLNSDLIGYPFELNISGNTVTANSRTGNGNDSNRDLTRWTANTADNERLNAGNNLAIFGGKSPAEGRSGGVGHIWKRHSSA